MESDISILSAPDAQAWASFLRSKLTEDKYGCTVRVQPVPVSGASQGGAGEDTETHREAQVQILLISPNLIDSFEQSTSEEGCEVDFHSLYPRPSRAVAVYCGCDPDDTEVTDILNAHLKNYLKWAKCTAGQEEGEVNMVLATILRVLESDGSNGTDSGFREEDIYLVPPLPRTVGEENFRIVPEHITSNGEELYILFEEAVKSPVVAVINCEESLEVLAKEETPSTFSFILPDNLPNAESVDVTVFSDGMNMGSVTIPIESRLDRLNRLLNAVTNPVELMAQALGLSASLDNLSPLDLKMKKIFQTNCPGGNFQAVFDLSNQGGILGRKSEKAMPTILHLAARFGLKELCAELLSCPGAVQAFTVENAEGDLPDAIAAHHGHQELAKFLTDYKNTGVPIAMVYDEMITAKRVKSDQVKGPSPAAPKEESLPEPCPGGNYSDSSRQSIYIDMTSVSNKRDSQHSTASAEARSSVSNTSSVSPRPVSNQRNSSTRKKSVNLAGEGSSAAAVSVERPPLAPPPLDRSSSRRVQTPEISPLVPSGTTIPPPIKPRPNACSPKLPPKPPVDRALSSPHVQIVERVSPEELKLRPHSDSDVSSNSSVDGVTVTPAEPHPKTEQQSIPVPFAPASVKDISSVSVTCMSEKDQALRTILQSAAEGVVSLQEAQTLVKNWDDQYRKSVSFHEKWDTIKTFQPSPEAELEAVKPRKRSESFFSKVFKRKTKTSETPQGKHTPQMIKKTSAPALLYPGSPSNLETDQRSSVKSRLGRGPAAGDFSNMRTNSIRVSRALEDRDISDLPDLPRRSPVPSQQGANVGANRPRIGKGYASTGNLAVTEAPHQAASRRRFSTRPYSPGRAAAFSTASPRLPDPDNTPPTG